jgi:hypothetical protein
MRWRSQHTSAYRWNLTHLTLVDESYTREGPPEEDQNVSNAIVEGFPMINGLRKLKMVFMEHPGLALLDKLSQKFKAHEIDTTFVVWAFLPSQRVTINVS